MQRLTPEQLLHRLHPRIALPRPAVERVAEQRMSQLGEVNADLMSAAGFQTAFYQRYVIESFQHFKMGDRLFPIFAFRIRGKNFPESLMTSYMCNNRSFIFLSCVVTLPS